MNNIKVCRYFKSKFLEFKVLQLFSFLISQHIQQPSQCNKDSRIKRSVAL